MQISNVIISQKVVLVMLTAAKKAITKTPGKVDAHTLVFGHC